MGKGVIQPACLCFRYQSVESAISPGPGIGLGSGPGPGRGPGSSAGALGLGRRHVDPWGGPVLPWHEMHPSHAFIRLGKFVLNSLAYCHV